MSWLTRLFGRDTLERDLDRELQFHLDSRTDDLVRLGTPPAEARRLARLELGGIELTKEKARDARGTRVVEDWWHDTKYALRAMARTKAFSAAAIVTLALGIGASTAVWSVIDALILRALPVQRPEELRAMRRVGDQNEFLISYGNFHRVQKSLPPGASLAAMSATARMYAAIGEAPEPVIAQLVTGEWFPLLGVGAETGSVLSQADDQTLGAHPVVVLSHGFWQRRFGGDPSIVGKTLRINGTPLTVKGIAEREFNGLTVGSTVDVWIPVMMQHEVRYAGNAFSENSDTEKPWPPQDGINWLSPIGRVPEGDGGAATAALDRGYRDVMRAQLTFLDSADFAQRMKQHVELDPITRGFSPLRQAYGDSLRALMVGVLLVLLIACGNVAGLLLARSAARTHEIAIRVSLGARPGRLVRQVLTESVTLALLGGAGGILVAKWGSQALLRLASATSTAVPLSVNLDWRVLGFALGVSLITGLIFGMAPAFGVARTNLHDAFKTGGRGIKGNRLPLGRTLVVSQIALSLLLVTAAGLFAQTLNRWLSIDPGYAQHQVLQARVDTRAARFRYDELPGLHQRLLEAVSAVPGVESASLSLMGVASGATRTGGMVVPGITLAPDNRTAQETYVTPGFLATVGIPLLYGRQLTEADRAGSPKVVIVSEAAAKHFFGKTDVVGQRIGYNLNDLFEVVGVARDVRFNNLKQAAPKMMYRPLAQGPQEFIASVEARFSGRPELVAAGIRTAIAGAARGLPIREVVTLEDMLTRGLVRERMVARLGGAFAVIALLLAGVGLYGVMGYSVSRRTNEMGVRLALGASPRRVAWVVLRDGLTTIGAGLAAGALLSIPVMGLLRKLIWGVEPHDPATMIVAAMLLASVGALAGALPAFRAARIDPVEAMRAE
jgi:predicted permease